MCIASGVQPGEAISFACEHYAFHLPEIEAFIGYSIPVIRAAPEHMPELEKALPACFDSWKNVSCHHHSQDAWGRAAVF